MIQRGRKSAAALAVIPETPPPPPEPPAALTKEQAQVWRDVVTARPNQFIPCLPLVQIYAIHVSLARELAQQIKFVSAGDIRTRNQLLRMLSRESAAIVRLAARLKLLPSRQEPHHPGPRPWEG